MKNSILFAALALNSIHCMAQINWETNPLGAIFAREGDETPEGTYRLTSGGYEVYTIASGDKNFQPVSLYYGINNADKAKVDAMAHDGKVPTSMNCFVVKTADGYIMFDTGLPASGGGKTIERLKSLNISPDDIKTIYLTHGHFDHIGGLLDASGKATYVNATVYVPSAELSFIKKTMGDVAREIEDAYKDRFAVFTTGEILPNNVMPIAAPGHTPGHTAYQIGNLLFVGDLMHGTSLQLIDPTICAKFDADRNQAIATRNSILSYAASNSLTVLCAHAPLNGIIF